MSTRSKPVVLDGHMYASKKDLRAAVRAYVGTAPVGTPLWDGLPYAVFDRHPDRDLKAGVGLWYIELRLTEYRNRGFYAVRLDNTAIDFSWRVALDFAPRGPTLAAAAREAVRDQVMAVGGPAVHVHHDGRPFQQLLQEWLAARGGGTPDLIHGDLHDYFKDPADEASWRAYHQREAVLRPVPVEEHRRLHGRAGS
jgi:hypothetical protein